MHCFHNCSFYYEDKEKNYPQVYLEECKYKVKKINTPRFISIELETDSESDLESNTTTES